MSTEMGDAKEITGSQPDAHPSRDGLRRLRRTERCERYQEILNWRQAGLSPRQIATRIGMSVRTIERWLTAGGEPEHRRRPARQTCINPFRDYLDQRLRDGQHNGALLWAEIRRHGFAGSRATLYRWLATRRSRPAPEAPLLQWRPPSRRGCAWLLSKEPSALDENTRCYLHHLFEHAPGLLAAGELARRFAALIRGDDEKALDQWIADAAGDRTERIGHRYQTRYRSC